MEFSFTRSPYRYTHSSTHAHPQYCDISSDDQSLYAVLIQGLPGPHGDRGPEGPQGKQVCHFLTTFTYPTMHICCDLCISFYVEYKQEVRVFLPR